MADNPVISQITLPNGSTYDIKDATAREAIENINSFDYIICSSAANTPKDVTWISGSATITGTLEASASTKGNIYLVPSTNGTKNIYDEYITINTTGTTYVWELFGHTNINVDDLGDLAYKNSASASYTPAGSVSQPSFTGTSLTSTGNFTPQGSVTLTSADSTSTGAIGYLSAASGSFTGSSMTSTGNFTPQGSVSVSSAGSTDTVYSITAVGTLPSLTTTVSDENLTIGFSQGTLPTKGSAQTVKTGDASYSFSGTQGSVSVSGTPEGSVSVTGTTKYLTGSFSGTQGSVSVSGTPAGTVSQPSFSGTAATITVT